MKRLVVTLFFSTLALAAISCSRGKATPGALSDDSAKAKESYGLWVADSDLCTGVEKYQPINPGTEFDPGKVYFYTRVAGTKEGKVYHRYSRLVPGLNKGIWREVFSMELPIRSTNWTTWTYINAETGSYRADVLAEDKKTLMKGYAFKVRGESLVATPVADAKPVSLDEAKLAAQVENYKAIQPEGGFTAGSEGVKVYVFLVASADATASAPTAVYLRYSKKETGVDGEADFVPVHTGSLPIKGKKWTTYYNVQCTPGEWQIDILGADGKTVLKTLTTEVKEKPSQS